jgi:hypothetical protein
VGEIGLLLGMAQTSAAFRLVFAFRIVADFFLGTVLLAVLFYTLGLGLLVCGGLGFSSGFGFGSLLGLFALDLGVFGRVP